MNYTLSNPLILIALAGVLAQIINASLFLRRLKAARDRLTASRENLEPPHLEGRGNRKSIFSTLQVCAPLTAGMATPRSDLPSVPTEIDKKRTGFEWPDDKPFPLTREEAYWIMRGWMVRPASRPNVETFLEMPGGGRELIDGYIQLKG